MFLPNKIKQIIDKSTLIKIFLCMQAVTILYIPEALLLLYIAQFYGKFTAMAVIVATSLLGLFFISGSIAATIHQMRRAAAGGKRHTYEIGALFVLLICGVLIITPGPISSLVGVVVYYTPLRRVFARLIIKHRPDWIENAYYYTRLG